MANENEEMVTIVNTVSRRTQTISKQDSVQFLRKHTLFRLVEKIPAAEPKRKVRKVIKKMVKEVKKEEDTSTLRKEAESGSGGPTPRSSGSDVGATATKRRGRELELAVAPVPAMRISPLITFSLREMHEVVRLFTSSPAGCVDWQMISDTATGGRVSAGDVEYAANEFLPHVHYRPSIGMVVMERQSKIPSEHSKHKQTVKRMRHGLGPLLCKLKTFFVKQAFDDGSATTLDSSPEQQPQVLKTSETSSEENLRKRALLAISRFEKGHVPVYALRQAPVASIDAEAGSLVSTGRLRKRYETKAMRLAKQAVEATGILKSEGSPQLEFSAPPFFHATARQFAKLASSPPDEEDHQ